MVLRSIIGQFEEIRNEDYHGVPSIEKVVPIVAHLAQQVVEPYMVMYYSRIDSSLELVLVVGITDAAVDPFAGQTVLYHRVVHLTGYQQRHHLVLCLWISVLVALG